jgi:L-seryl-tRNA(Ser) seleniumtransferase
MRKKEAGRRKAANARLLRMSDTYRALPSVDKLLRHKRLRALGEDGGTLTELARQALETARGAIARGSRSPSEEQLAEDVLGRARLVLEPSLRPVINATGVIIHTNLGRVPLSDAAIEAMAAVSRGYSNLEFDLEGGERGSRFTHLEAALRQLTGAEAAIAVNNNASALLLALTALAAGRGVIVSRGQAVEIGGGFRIPDVMRQSGAALIEVGTTNRTYLRDYEAAITPETVAVMRVHTSNFRITGFTEQPQLRDLARVAHERGLLLLDDIGSGCLLDVRRFGLAAEPAVGESMAAGADLCLFSGDKLLGGPQAGIIAGRAELVDTLRRHPLARAVRMDKASIAALHATLLHYLRGEALTHIPVWRMIAMPLAEIEARAWAWVGVVPGSNVIDGRSMIGGGSLPEESLPTKLLAVEDAGARLTQIARALRLGDPAVVARIEGGKLLLDPRTVDPAQDGAIVKALSAARA